MLTVNRINPAVDKERFRKVGDSGIYIWYYNDWLIDIPDDEPTEKGVNWFDKKMYWLKPNIEAHSDLFDYGHVRNGEEMFKILNEHRPDQYIEPDTDKTAYLVQEGQIYLPPNTKFFNEPEKLWEETKYVVIEEKIGISKFIWDVKANVRIA